MNVSNLFECVDSALALAHVSYTCLAVRQVLRFRHRRAPVTPPSAPVSVLVPVCGAPRGLAECLRSICRLEHPGLQVIFGLHHADDPGRAVIEAVMREFPGVDTTLVVDGRRIGTNPKVCNLANMYRVARHDVLVMVDSDVLVDERFASVLSEPLREPDVGVVTCPYQARPAAGMTSALGGMFIDEWVLPSALVEGAMHEMQVCYGAAMAVTRASLARAGGFAALADATAEDDVLGERMVAAGLRVRVVPHVVGTVVAEHSLRDLWHHELRWLRSVRVCRPLDHALAIVMFSFPALLAMFDLAPSRTGIGLLGLVVGLRYVLHYAVRARFGSPTRWGAWLVPVRELMSFAVWLASFASRDMRWGNLTLRALPGRREAAQIQTSEES